MGLASSMEVLFIAATVRLLVPRENSKTCRNDALQACSRGEIFQAKRSTDRRGRPALTRRTSNKNARLGFILCVLHRGRDSRGSQRQFLGETQQRRVVEVALLTTAAR